MSVISFDTAEQLAKKFRTDHGLSLTESVSLKSFLRKQNILTLFRPLSEGFYGMSLKSQSGLKFILVNSANPKGRQHYTIAHELYHLYIEESPKPHVCNNDNGKSASEKSADAFAAALLMPYEGLLSFISNIELTAKKIDLSTIIKIEQYYSVSRQALLYRLNNCKLLPSSEVSRLLPLSPKQTAKEYGYDTSLYSKGNEGLVIGDFGEKARVLYERELISEGHYNELLNLIANE